MKDSIIFDTKIISEKLNIPKDELEAIQQSIREEFPDDEMMYELHLVRALKSLQKREKLKDTID